MFIAERLGLRSALTRCFRCSLSGFQRLTAGKLKIVLPMQCYLDRATSRLILVHSLYHRARSRRILSSSILAGSATPATSYRATEAQRNRTRKAPHQRRPGAQLLGHEASHRGRLRRPIDHWCGTASEHDSDSFVVVYKCVDTGSCTHH